MSEKKASPVAYLFLFLATAVTGSALSFLYLLINRVNPIIYLSILAAIALGAAMGFVSTKIVKLFKIKSVVPAVAVVVLGCLVFTYFKWALYVATDARRELNDWSFEEIYLSAIWIEILNNEFVDENDVIYSNLEHIITDMQNFSAYDYGITDNELALWWAYGAELHELSNRDIRNLQAISFYEAMGFDYDFGMNPRIAANEIREIIGSSGFIYIKHFGEHDEAPTVVYFMTSPAALFDAVVRINGEGRWTYSSSPGSSGSDTLISGVFLWIVWLVEFFIICGYAVIAAPKAIKALNAPQSESMVFNYDTNPPPVSAVSQNDSGWGNSGFGATAPLEQVDEFGRPIAQSDQFDRPLSPVQTINAVEESKAE
ncbi:MAG: hypothetical protein FWE74_04755 [Oscillospiraceae bacterium]|nr:hypothetical protein [Oscillospiraceae bacterium]